MNWARGFFRIWLLTAVIWSITCSIIVSEYFLTDLNYSYPASSDWIEACREYHSLKQANEIANKTKIISPGVVEQGNKPTTSLNSSYTFHGQEIPFPENIYSCVNRISIPYPLEEKNSWYLTHFLVWVGLISIPLLGLFLFGKSVLWIINGFKPKDLL